MNAVKVQKRFSNSCASCHHQFDSVDKYKPTTYMMPSQDAQSSGAYAKKAMTSSATTSPKKSMPTITSAFGTGSLLLPPPAALLRFAAADDFTFMRWICRIWCGGGGALPVPPLDAGCCCLRGLCCCRSNAIFTHVLTRKATGVGWKKKEIKKRSGPLIRTTGARRTRDLSSADLPERAAC